MENYTGEHVLPVEGGLVVVSFKLGKKSGLTKFVDNSGKVLSQINYEDDLICGEMQGFHPGGSVAVVANFRGGVQDGPFFSFYESGVKQVASHYKNGKLDGVFTAFDGFGDVAMECEYQGDVRHGRSVVYYPKALGGLAYELARYEAGLLEGDVVTYDEAGEVMTVTPYSRGRAQGYPARLSALA